MLHKKSIITGLIVCLLAIACLPSAAFASAPEPPADIPASFMDAAAPFLNGDGEIPDILSDALSDAAGIQISSREDILELIRSADTAEAARQLRSLLDMTQAMTDEQLRAEIAALAAEYGYTLDDAELDAAVRFCRSLETFSADELREKLDKLRSGILTAGEIGAQVSGIAGALRGIAENLKDAFERLLGLG